MSNQWAMVTNGHQWANVSNRMTPLGSIRVHWRNLVRTDGLTNWTMKVEVDIIGHIISTICKDNSDITYHTQQIIFLPCCNILPLNSNPCNIIYRSVYYSIKKYIQFFRQVYNDTLYIQCGCWIPPLTHVYIRVFLYF